MERMIIVVEGPSAAGKTTFCTTHGGDRVSAEPAVDTGPSDDASAADHARFWSGVNCRRWTEVLQIEAERGLAICDTAPLKLHYDYCLARIGLTPWDRFDAGVAEANRVIAGRELGIADLILVNVPDGETLLRRRDTDTTRRPRQFDLHVRLGPTLHDWYETLARIEPGRVRWRYPAEVPPAIERDRYDADLFNTWMQQLPRSATVAHGD